MLGEFTVVVVAPFPVPSSSCRRATVPGELFSGDEEEEGTAAASNGGGAGAADGVSPVSVTTRSSTSGNAIRFCDWSMDGGCCTRVGGDCCTRGGGDGGISGGDSCDALVEGCCCDALVEGCCCCRGTYGGGGVGREVVCRGAYGGGGVGDNCDVVVAVADARVSAPDTVVVGAPSCAGKLVLERSGCRYLRACCRTYRGIA